jgi:hypothetical protein
MEEWVCYASECTLEGIYGTATQVGHSWFQHILASNESSILGWMKVLQLTFLIWLKTNLDKKVILLQEMRVLQFSKFW